MKNVKLTIEYNGSKFSGWQKQDGQRTVQGEIENAFFVLTGQNLSVEASGRTDKGVHAYGQIASVKFDCKIPLKNLKYALNNLLPADVRVTKVEFANDDFHARFSAKRKTYEYVVKVGGQPSAIDCDLVGFYQYDVDKTKIDECIKILEGKHNFKGFCSTNTQVTNFEREIYFIKYHKSGKIFKFSVCGNGFLYNMVRIIVGTLLDVGSGKISIENVKKALKTGDRSYSGKTMEPNGLYLKKVEYEKTTK